MQKMRLPNDAVIQKMEADGMNESCIKKLFPDYTKRNNNGGPTSGNINSLKKKLQKETPLRPTPQNEKVRTNSGGPTSGNLMAEIQKGKTLRSTTQNEKKHIRLIKE